MNEIFQMKPSEFEISHSVKSYDEKTAENGRHFNETETIKKQSKL